MEEEEQQQENNSSVPSNKLEIIEAEPLAVIAPNNIEPRKGKRSKEDFKDGTNIGLPEGWFYEQRPRTNANYIGKIDQFFYEPETNKQFRSLKSVEKYLASKGQKLNPDTPKALQGNTDQQKIEAPPPVVPFDRCNADSDSPNHNPESSKNVSKTKKKNVSGQKAMPRNLHFNFKEAPEEITWVLMDADNDKWAAFMGDLKVQKEVEQYWADTFKIINSGNNERDDDK